MRLKPNALRISRDDSTELYYGSRVIRHLQLLVW